MNNKLFISLLLMMHLISFTAIAQRGDRVESAKIAFLSGKLNLDPRTAERFWPVYNQYNEEMHTLIQNKKGNSRTTEEILDQEQKAIDIKRKYSNLFSKILSDAQVNQLFQSEKEFNKILIRRMNKMEDKQQMRGNQRNQELQDQPRISPRQPRESMPSTPRNQNQVPPPAQRRQMR